MPGEQSDDARGGRTAGGFASPDSQVAPAAPAAIPPGWYPDPSGGAQQRWWNGATWTDHRTAAPRAEVAAAPLPHKRRMPVLAIVGIVVGSLILAGALREGVVQALSSLESAVEDGASAGQAEPPSATSTAEPSEAPVTDVPAKPIMAVPDGWARTSILNGGGTVAYNPEWEDVSDLIGADAIEQNALDYGVEVSVDGAWQLGGDYDTGMSLIAIHTAVDVGGPSSARIEALAFVKSVTTGIDEVEITSEGPFTTAYGHEAYLVEYEFPYYGEQLTDAVAVIVNGHSQVVVYTNGSEALGSGIDELEMMLDSIWLN